MVVSPHQLEREKFAAALNERIKQDCPDEWGRAQWLYETLKTHHKAKRLKGSPVSPQTCGYWLRAEKMAGPANQKMLCDALGMTRSQLLGDSTDARLQRLNEVWNFLPEHMKNGIDQMISGAKERA
jgi:hypothetical protein